MDEGGVDNNPTWVWPRNQAHKTDQRLSASQDYGPIQLRCYQPAHNCWIVSRREKSSGIARSPNGWAFSIIPVVHWYHFCVTTSPSPTWNAKDKGQVSQVEIIQVLHLGGKIVLEGAMRGVVELCGWAGGKEAHWGIPCRRMWRPSRLEGHYKKNHEGRVLLTHHLDQYS